MASDEEIRQWKHGDVLMSVDNQQDQRLNRLEERLLTVEQAVQEIGGMAKVLKFGVVIAAASLGYDLSGVVS